jgi:hypothetical protein
VSVGTLDECDRCHKPTTWTGAGFDHSRFSLTGAHLTTACSACHTSGIFSGLSHACVSCHMSDYQSVQNPNHVTDNFSTNCEACHNTMSWQGAAFNHAGITTGCVQCHLPDYQATTNPSHSAGNFPTACEKSFSCVECHQTPTNYSIVSCTHCHEHRKPGSYFPHDA